MKLKWSKIGAVIGSLCGAAVVTFAITQLFVSDSITSNLTKKTIFQIDLTANMQDTAVGPGDSFSVSPAVYNDATEEMYAFLKVEMPVNASTQTEIYSFTLNSTDWVMVDSTEGEKVYAYAGTDMTVLNPGDSTSSLTDQMTMKNISIADYAAIADINVTVTAYVIGVDGVDTDPVNAWIQCKGIGNIQ